MVVVLVSPSLTIFNLLINAFIVQLRELSVFVVIQEAQLLLGDRATRKHAKNC